MACLAPGRTTVSKAVRRRLTVRFGQMILDSEQTRALREKQAEPLFGVLGRIAVSAATNGRLMRFVRASSAGYSCCGHLALVWSDDYSRTS